MSGFLKPNFEKRAAALKLRLHPPREVKNPHKIRKSRRLTYRQRIIRMLKVSPTTTSDIAWQLNISKTLVYKRLAKLKKFKNLSIRYAHGDTGRRYNIYSLES